MRRLVYTPKVEAYIKADQGVFDLSPYITSCSVARKINQVSTATLTFRNPEHMFTENVYKDPVTKETIVGPMFHPMDPIVISMTRLRDRDIQVFTGFCDTTPYLQLYPGLVSLEASCTLKRLLYTYWDPGLPFLQTWLFEHGWSEGTLGSSQGIYNPDDTQQPGGSKKKKVTDGNLGKLLYDVLHDIGGWPDGHIYIEPLPKSIVEVVSNLYELEKGVSELAQKEFHALLRDIIGAANSGATGGGGGTGNPVAPGDSPETGATVTPEQVGVEMIRQGFPKDAQIIANGIETVEAESSFEAVFNGSCCYGYWQIYISVHGVSEDDANTLSTATAFAYTLWKNAGNCFACQPGPNPWQAGVDSGSKYLDLAERIVAGYDATTAGQDESGPGARTS